MYIVHIASELAPLAKVGGLGDVIHGLSKELAKLSHQVEIILPKYDCIQYSQLKDLKVQEREVWSFEGPHRYHNTVWSAEVDGLRVLLIEPHHPNFYFSRGKIYGAHDDNDRFAYFSRTALEYLFKSNKRPDVIHIHDWPTSLIAPLYKDMYIPLGFKNSKIVLTIHNLEHQGKCAPHNLARVGLRAENYLTPDKMQDPYAPGTFNLLKGGIVYADAITTVSPQYEKEIKTAQGGCGLDETLIKYQDKLHGILNGIDEAYWNPAKDGYLVKQYATHGVDSPEKMGQVLEGKKENKRHVCTHFGIPYDEKKPLVASVTRLVSQKGPDLIEYALLRTLEKEGQFVLLGLGHQDEIEARFQKLKKTLSKNKNASICLDKDEALAHLIYAAADLFIIPSLFEPCGLTQLIALRYAAVPVARATGGLVDTVFDIDTSKKPMNERNGFTFDFPDTKGIDWALDRALNKWFQERTQWHQLMQQAIRTDFSWTHSATEYVKLYHSLIR